MSRLGVWAGVPVLSIVAALGCAVVREGSQDGGGGPDATGTGGASLPSLPGIGGLIAGEGGAPGGGPRGPSGDTICGFAMPNAASTGLPNPAAYDTTAVNVVTDKVTGLMWEREADPPALTFDAARDHCASNRLGGYSDWRLPTVLELASILDVSVSSRSSQIDSAAFPGTPAAYFWTSLPLAGEILRESWYVSFTYPEVTFAMGTIYLNQVRCVRAGGAPAGRCVPRNARYQILGDLVMDSLTSLTWQRAAADAMTLDAARTFCAGVGEGFRVPSVNELLTLVDFTIPYPGPMIDTSAFSGTPAAPSDDFWTSSSVGGDVTRGYAVNFGNGRTAGSPTGARDETNQVRCVR